MDSSSEIGPEVAARLRDSVREEVQNRFRDLCLARGLATDEQLARCAERAAAEKLQIGQILLRERLIDTQQYLQVLGELFIEPPAPEAPFQRLGRYEILAELGKGGLGTVYKARDTQLKRTVALKVLRSDVVGRHRVIRMAREAQAAARLSHPNIVTVHDAGEIDGRPYICMEHVDGRHLGEVIRSGTRTLREMAELLRKVAQAVEYAHAQGIVHRDLKPGNIIVDAKGEPIIVDFGLARIVDPDEYLSLTTTPIGTPFYMSPEHIRDPKAVGPRSDVYSLGVCLYEAMTGRNPYAGTEPVRIFHRILEEEPPRPRSIKPELPADLETICLKAMGKDPARRYPSAAALAADLDRFVKGEPIEARAPSVGHRLRRFVQRNRVAVIAAAAALLVAAASLLALRESARTSRLEADRKLQEQLKPLEALIQETRLSFYIKEADIGAKLRRLEKMLDDLDVADHADAWFALGAGRQLVGDLPRTEEALRKAESLAPETARIHLHLGRTYVERAFMLLFEDEGLAGGEGMKRYREYCARALVHLRRPFEDWEGAGEMDRHIALAYRRLAEGDIEALIRHCREGLDRFGGAVGAEEYYFLIGCRGVGPQQMESLTKAIDRRAHFALARFIRGNHRNQQGDAAGAMDDYTRAIAANPRLFGAYNNRGLIKTDLRDFDGAVADFDPR